MRMKKVAHTLLAVLITGAFSYAPSNNTNLAFAQPVGLPDLGRPDAADLPPRLESRIGELIMSQTRRDRDFIDNPDVSFYLNAMATRLANYSTDRYINLTVFPVRDPQINAFAMPGGFIGVNSGLIVAADSESELAGVLAHEIAHVVQKHIARGVGQGKKDNLLMLASILAAIAAAQLGGNQAAQAALMLGQAAAVDSSLKFSQSAEHEADRTGFTMLQGAGYDPSGMASFFEKLSQVSSLNQGAGQVFARTHPLTIDRMSDLQNRARQYSSQSKIDATEFYFIQAQMRVLQTQGVQDLLDVIGFLDQQVKQQTGIRKAGAAYGLGVAWLKRKDYNQARDALQLAQQTMGKTSPLLLRLETDIAFEQGNYTQALTLANQGNAKWPDRVSFVQLQADSLLRLQRASEAQKLLLKGIERFAQEPSLRFSLAEAYSQQNNQIARGRTMAEYYRLIGALPAAIDQLQRARLASKDFYEQSEIDTRIVQLKNQLQDEKDLMKQFS